MPERWEAELLRLREVKPSLDVWERATRGPSHPNPPPAPGWGGRRLVVVVSVAVLAAAGVGAWRAFGPSSESPPTREPTTPSGSFLTLPKSATAALGGGTSHITVTVTAQTNLPDGTIVLAKWETGPHGGGGPQGKGVTILSVNTVVHDGELQARTDEPFCNYLGSGFDLTIEVRPFYEDWVVPGPMGSGSPSPWPPTQPESVLQVLGDHFQDLTGNEVTSTDSSRGPINQIVVTGSYDWPAPPQGFAPPALSDSGTLIASDASGTEKEVSGRVEFVAGVMARGRGSTFRVVRCDLLDA